MKFLVGVLAAALLTGCSSTPISVREAVRAPADEIYAFQSKPSRPYSTVTVLRDGGINASACDFVIYIDGRRVAKLGTGEKASFFIDPGQINIGAGLAGSGLCSGQAIKTIGASAPAAKEIIFRVSSDMTGLTIGPYVDYR
ncbi:hypothetical protein AB2M95_02800 [Pseudomonas chlororaphis]|uniref:hypothetical protein n=1 Tax=Pseudomonas chlororaphis TaxID=587753 RepID=UPI0034627814